jgi:toxin ParE1/3/4
MVALRLSPGATAEFDEAADWYLTEDPDLMAQFVEAINRSLARIVASPFSFPVVAGTQVRRATVKRFSYIILFSVRPDHTWVYSIFHTSRNPIIWRGRID